MKQYETIRSGVRLALAAGLAITAGIPTSALAARDSGNQNSANLGTVTVTGTRIKRTDIERSQPVLHIDRQQIQSSGLVSIGELLQRLSSAGSAANRQLNDGGTGATHVDLRYLGSQRVLVLINGERLALGGNAGGTGVGLQLGLSQRADLNTIPTSIIDHIDVLKDGASAVYGTDAIAGVVNIITRKDFNGAEASAYVGGYEDHSFDGLSQQYSATLGHSWDRGNVTVNLSYKQSDKVKQKDRAISRSFAGTKNYFFGTGHRGRFILNENAPGGSQDLVLKGPAPYGTTTPTRADLKTFQDPQDRNQTDVDLGNLQTPQNRLGAYFQGYYDVTDHVQFNSTLIYSDRSSSSNIGPYAVRFYPGYLPRRSQEPVTLARDNPFNPFGFDIVASNNAAENEVGQFVGSAANAPPNTFSEDSRFLQYIGGFSGDFTIGDRAFNWDTSFIYGNNDEDSHVGGRWNTEHVRRALGSPSQCGPGSVHPDCVPYNLFGLNTQAANDYVHFNGLFHDVNSERIYSANISSSDIYDLPYGPVGIALGYQHREQGGKLQVDSLTAAGLSNGNLVHSFSGGFDVNAVYGELNIPILTNLPGIRELSVDGQARHANYSTFGGNTSTRAGLRYQPVKDLLIRGTWAQGFRAPGINDLFGGLSENFPALSDPCNQQNFPTVSSAAQQRCVAAGVPNGGYRQTNQIPVLNGSNRNLQPETSISRTLGLVYSPSWLPGLDLNADYYKIEVDKALSTINSQQLFNACYVGGNQTFCDNITRNSNGTPTQVLDGEVNLASFSTNGFDIGISYKFPSTPVGDFTLTANETHIILFNETTPNFDGNGGFSTQSYVNGSQGGLGFPNGVPANKANLDVTWNYGNWSANYYVQYIEGTTEPCRRTTPVTSLDALGLCSIPKPSPLDAKNRMGDTFYHDVQVSYRYQPINTTFTVGVNNLLDRDPPTSYSAYDIGYNPFLYRLPGRFLYGRLTARF